MRFEERERLAERPAGEAVDEVMAVALDVGEAEQRDQREVLLHRQAGLRRQVLAREEVPAAAPSAFQMRQRARLTIDL